ncbi:uncharacterized protein V1518DRAFT_420485 [Limtongia smithiae]|uniref:uncharacterized protein n=1 Tax=Limtongia smithiae TaxID=1125753 RepID=UPI0034CE589C
MSSRMRRAWRRRFQEIRIREEQIDENDIVFLDEQQQEELIASLRAESDSINKTYKTAFTTLTLIQTPIFVFHPVLIYQGASSLTLCALTSLLASAYIMHTTPALTSSLSTALAAEAAAASANRPSDTSFTNRALRLAQRCFATPQDIIMALNLVLAGAIAGIAYVRFYPMMGVEYIWLSPLLSLGAVALVRKWMREGDADTLERFRYKYKGA